MATLIFWNVALDWLSYRFTAFQRVAEPEPLELIRDGRIDRDALHKELLTEEELMSKLREKGIEDLAKVRRAYMESDGTVSVIERK